MRFPAAVKSDAALAVTDCVVVVDEFDECLCPEPVFDVEVPPAVLVEVDPEELVLVPVEVTVPVVPAPAVEEVVDVAVPGAVDPALVPVTPVPDPELEIGAVAVPELGIEVPPPTGADTPPVLEVDPPLLGVDALVPVVPEEVMPVEVVPVEVVPVAPEELKADEPPQSFWYSAAASGSVALVMTLLSALK